MSGWVYQYTPYVWPMLGSAALALALAVYGWRHRIAPGATSFTVLALVVGLWAAGSAFEVAAVGFDGKFFWFRFQGVLAMPAVIAGLCFALEYAGLGRLLTWRNLVLINLPTVTFFAYYFLGDPSAILAQVWFEGSGRREFTPLGLAFNVYGLALMVLSTAVFVVLFVRSPVHRKPVAVILLGHVGMRGAYLLEYLNLVPTTPVDVAVLGAAFTAATYSIALYRFRLFDVVPVARATVVERMADGVVVLDAQSRVADLNPAAQKLLGVRRSWVLGRSGAEALGAYPALVDLVRDGSPRQIEVPLGTASDQRWHEVSSAPLADGRGFRLGALVVLHDITALKQAHERLLKQERALAALRERELLARELHDSIGQVLAYVSLQIEAALKLLDDGKTPLATSQLERLSSIARDAHADVREFILELRSAPAAQQALFPTLRRYLDGFTQNYGVATSLVLSDGLDEAALAPEAQAQLLRIVQEALSNARKHGGARSATVTFERQGALMRVSIRDDGGGFDPSAVDGGFGLRFMGERAAEVGGCVEVQSAPGEGTRVVVAVPVREPRDA